jgi:hypothetical protein
MTEEKFQIRCKASLLGQQCSTILEKLGPKLKNFDEPDRIRLNQIESIEFIFEYFSFLVEARKSERFNIK